MALTPDDPDLTSALLGETSPARTAEIESELRRNPSLRREASEIRASAKLIGSVMRRRAPVFVLTEQQRAAVLRGERRTVTRIESRPVPVVLPARPRRPAPRRFWSHPGLLAGGIAAALAAGFFLMPGIRGAWEWQNPLPSDVAETEDTTSREGLIRVTPGEPGKVAARPRTAPQPAPPEDAVPAAEPPAPEVPAIAAMPPGAVQQPEPAAKPLTPAPAPQQNTARTSPASGGNRVRLSPLLDPEMFTLPRLLQEGDKDPLMGLPAPGQKSRPKGKDAKKEEKQKKDEPKD